MNKITLTIGIPAYNEKVNINMLLIGLLRQRLAGDVLEKSIVNSNASTDNTVQITKSIHVITPYFYPISAGVETNTLETYSFFVKKGYTVTVHTSRDTLTEKNVLALKEKLNGIQIVRYPFRRFFGFFPKKAFENNSIVCFHNFDLFPYLYLLIFIWLQKILRKKNYTLIFSPHGSLNPDLRLFPKGQILIRWIIYRWPTIFLVNNVVDGVRAVSDWEKKELSGIGVKSTLIKTIFNGLENEAFRNPDEKASENIKKTVKNLGKYIIQIGRISNQKNYETTIEALSKLTAEITFVILGPTHDKKYKAKLELLVQDLGLKNRVVFLGVVRGADKYYLIKHAELMVHMATWESFCNVVHEGMSQGLVCIVANNTALPYLIKDGMNGYCLPAYDVNALVEKISFVLKNKKSLEILDIGKRNIKFVAGHSWQNVAEKVERFYLEVLNKRKYEK